ncbi:lantibiotic dehydratase [Isoptericola halotolerans]|uniref:hypothetical protein n=1 Tax=Isoptericola halotolerans TaxID=300560 RepID=UPI00388DD460
MTRSTLTADSELFTAIGGSATTPEQKKNLLRIKRALGRGRLPDRDVLESLPEHVADSLRQLGEDLITHQEASDQVEIAFAADRARTRALLAERATTLLVRNGILHSAPSLEDFMDSESWPERLTSDKRAARVAQFVYRAAAKTSPFSTFTCTGRAGVEDHPGESSTPHEGSTHLVRQLDGKIWALLVRDLAERPSVVARWDLRPNPSLTWVESLEKFVLLGPPPAEHLRSFSTHPSIRLVDEAPADPAPADSWSRSVAGVLGTGDEAQAADTVQMLLRAGVLEADCPVSESVDQPVGDLVRWLEQSGARSEVPYYGTLSRLALLLAPCPSPTDPQELRTQHRELNAAAAELLAALGRESDHLGTDLEPVHESAVLSGHVSAGDRPSAEDLATVAAARSWLSVHDVKWPGRLAVSAYADDVIPSGRSVPLLEFYRATHLELKHGQGALAEHLRTWFSAVPLQPGPATPATPLNAPMLELHRERRRCADLVLGSKEEGEVAVRISLAQVVEQLRTRPERLRATAPAAVYLQATRAVESPWVINVIHGGRGRGRTRTDHLMRCAGLNPEPIRVPQGDDAIPAEYTGTHGSSLNAHRATLPAGIDYPFTTGPEAGQERIPVGRLHVRRSTTTGLVELVDSRSGTRVEPTHVGMLADYQLPPLARFMERVFGDAYLLHPSNPPFASDLALDRLTDITRIPRVQVDGVVVQRRRWIVPASLFPRPQGDRSSASYLGSLHMWFAENDLPLTSFARAWGRDLRGSKAKSRKPMLLDLDSWWTVWELLRHSTDADFVVLDEALPDPYLRSPRAPAVELLVEVPSYLADDETRSAV